MLTANTHFTAAGQNQPLVLVVQDDARLSSFLSRELAFAGYRVEQIADAGQALAVFPLISPDVVVLDLVVPGVDGLELARKLRAQSRVPILMLAAPGGVD